MTKSCERCGNDFEVTPNNFKRAKYCADCRKIVQREQLRQYKQQRRQQAPPATVICQRCGKTLIGKRRNCKWCDECRRIVNREQDRRSRERLKQRAQPKPTTKSEYVPQPKTRTCRYCHGKFTSINRTTICPECKRIKHEEFMRQEEQRQAKLRQKNLKIDKATGKPVKTLEDWSREAAACNLDYGTYRVLVEQQGKTFEELKATAGIRCTSAHAHNRGFGETHL
ncbi:MAG: hypothetical protein IKE46_00440 [Selenomonadaceae bacterium]|nr:hypothetical protein [Selenomonadaceae bacterium]